MAMKILAKVVHGSHLYRTSGRDSDMDYKVIFVPSFHELMWGEGVKNKNYSSGGDNQNHAGDEDVEYIPIQKFLKDFMSGQAYAIEIVLAVANRNLVPYGDNCCTRPNFRAFCQDLVNPRNNSFPNELTGMVGYAVKQHYDYKASAENKEVLDHLLDIATDATAEHHTVGEMLNASDQLRKLMEYYPKKVELGSTVSGGVKFEYLIVIGKKFPYEITLNTAIDRLTGMVNKYGERTKTQFNPKSMHHALRVMSQVIELHTNGPDNLTWPLPDTPFLMAVKNGEVPEEECVQTLDAYYEALQSAEENSVIDFTEFVLQNRCNTFLRDLYVENMLY